MMSILDNPLFYLFVVPILLLILRVAADSIFPQKNKAKKRSRKNTSLVEPFLILVLLTTFLILNLNRQAESSSTGIQIDFSFLDSFIMFFLIFGWPAIGIAWYLTYRSRKKRLGLEQDLQSLKSLSPDAFEEFVAQLFIRRGYKAKVVGESGDHGVDIDVINPHGEKEIVQCKRWTKKWLGEKVVREFYGALMHDQSVVRGYIVTTSFYSNAAKQWAEGKPISLIDGTSLAESVQIIRERTRKAN